MREGGLTQHTARNREAWAREAAGHVANADVERLVELRNPGRDSGRYELFTAEWAERRPAEELWKARKAR